ncbi:DUF2716 domain-containing protein [Bacillus paralicheniformis]|uniref:DUF2716 domain-containing protein n=1 Tax=Bacillus paralicheniformis TaxID=1648923 RepID=UPI0011A5CDBE|nr:DUF2716 domain-containing protein [Bacillus paralicheniformis]TWK81856.1 hypothetical protein CHCC20331_4329 [Bacillus paralicheniformis]
MSWTVLSSRENDKVWTKVNRVVKWKPGLQCSRMKPPTPYIVYDVSAGFKEDGRFLADLEEKMIGVFKACTDPLETMYALDWRHEGYMFRPHGQLPKDEYGDWPVPIFPNGDYYFFFQRDFEWGVLGDPWRQTMTLYGEKLLDHIEHHPPVIFRKA